MAEKKRRVCDTCGGSGEIGFFAGESRFFITREECPACNGVGSLPNDDEPHATPGTEPDKEEDK
ncbi:MAG: hypothetical protein RBT36_04375 [Desulfobulbus sp.]|jgi:DnaJ-class molecular chaperone|nr:hypothetical protein [Desulfobulbus sp.]